MTDIPLLRANRLRLGTPTGGIVAALDRFWARGRALSRLQRHRRRLAILAFSLDERTLADLGQTRRLRYDWIGQLARAMMVR